MENYSLKEVFGDTCQINGIVGNKSHYFSSNVVIWFEDFDYCVLRNLIILWVMAKFENVTLQSKFTWFYMDCFPLGIISASALLYLFPTDALCKAH